MKSIFLMLVGLFVLISIPVSAQFGDLLDKAKEKAKEKVEQTEDSVLDKAMNPDENNQKNKSENDNAEEPGKSNQVSTKTYQNYDFVPGDKIIFEDDFSEDEVGEFPSHWDLADGQAQVSSFKGDKIFALTEGNYVSVLPLMKTDTYLASDTFTVEFDFYTQPGAYNEVGIRFWDPKNDDQSNRLTDDQNAVFVGNECSAAGLSGTYPEENFDNNRWHHVAIARKGRQLKVYEDQYRILNVPVFKGETDAVNFVGIGDQNTPIMLKNIRIAQGGNFNDTKHILTESKIITHGILFDIDKSTIKPQSMGTINEIYKILKDNPNLKFEIDGYTDNTGNSQHNVELSQKRADAVKVELTNLGINSSRLTTKGFGDSKPIDTNETAEGKANNRRVEFVKI